MKTSDIISMNVLELNKLNRKELSKLVSQAGSVANKRLARLEKNEIESPAYQFNQRNGGRFSVAGKNLNQLRTEYKRVSGFLNAKTSTVTGANEIMDKWADRLGYKLEKQQSKDMWSAYRKYLEVNPTSVKDYGSDQVQQFLAREIFKDNLSPDEIDELVANYLKKDYKEKKQGEVDETDVMFKKFKGKNI